MKDIQVIEPLLNGIPRADADRYRRMWNDQPAWGLGEHPAVLVIDMTLGFVENEAALQCVKSISRLLKTVREAKFPVIFTTPGVYTTDAENGAWLRGMPIDEYVQTLPPNLREAYQHALAHGGFDVAADIKPAHGEPVMVKPKPSAFFGTQLEALLIHLRVDTLIVCGAATGRCVRATVEDAFARNYRVLIPVECVTGGVDISHRVELLDMGVQQEVIADLASIDDLLSEIQSARLLPRSLSTDLA